MLALASTCSRKIHVAHKSFLPSHYFQISTNQLAALLTVSNENVIVCVLGSWLYADPLHREMQYGELDITHQEETPANQLTINVEAKR